MKLSELKTMKGIKNGFWPWLAFFSQTKEFLILLVLGLIAWVATLIFDPSTAAIIKAKFVGLFK